jgi:AraC-like DNA-binding protein
MPDRIDAEPIPRNPRAGVVRFHALHFADALHFPPEPGLSLEVVHARGRGTRLQIPAGWLSLCLPLSGRLWLESAESHWTLRVGSWQAWRDSPVRMGCDDSGAWLAVAGPLCAWQQPLRMSGRDDRPEIFPRTHACPRDLRRLLVRLARMARGSLAADDDPARMVEAVCAAVVEQQHDLSALVARCSGRTRQRRQQIMLRLLRVRHLIESCEGERPDLARLARSANYSPWHLIRVHRDVFGETPSEYAARLRLQHAWTLVRDTTTAICEISESLGFESQSAFCRSFKKSFGCTTTEARSARGETGSLAA